jgi:cellulose synthase/poly-beta-1,6-N-acetylglucosamine synthase-like glycosyltransferase
VSVVVSTRNRPERLRRLLRSLEAQTLRPDLFEVIVVDDGSQPPTRQVLEAELDRAVLALRTVRHERPIGPGGGRNSGWQAARAPLIAFVDDDCAAAPEWLASGLERARSAPTAVIQGRTEPERSPLCENGLLNRTVRIEHLGPQYETCNIFYPREVLESLDGFDEDFGTRPGGEDTDLAWRAIEAGHATVQAPDAVVFHAVERLGVVGTLRVAARWGPTIRVFARHPQTRVMLYRGHFWNVWHYLMWRSLLSLAGPRWLARLVLTLHLLELRRRARDAGAGSWAIPFLIVHDLVECWSVAGGAVRYRTLVL